MCFEIEDEEHFITKCQINAHECQNLYVKIVSKHPTFRNLSNHISHVLQRQADINMVGEIYTKIIQYS